MSKTYCVRSKQYTKNKNKNDSRTINGKTMTMISTYCYDGSDKNNRFIKKQNAKGLLSNIGLKTLLSGFPILGGILF